MRANRFGCTRYCTWLCGRTRAVGYKARVKTAIILLASVRLPSIDGRVSTLKHNLFVKMAHVFPNLNNFRLKDLIVATATQRESIEWAQNHGLLSRNKICEGGNCAGNNPMRLVNDKGTDGVIWQCSDGRVCRKKSSIRMNSFFSGSHLQIE